LDSKTHSGPLEQTAESIASVVKAKPEIALVLGSGLGGFAERLSLSHTFATRDLPGYPSLSVEGHSGMIHFGTVESRSRRSAPLMVFQGRVHFYETGSLELTTLPIDLAHLLGAKTLVITNAAGGINRSFRPGDFMLIDDVLSLNAASAGISESKKRATFVIRPFRRSDPPFDTELQNCALEAARTLGIGLHRGTYCWMKGPTYETPAEIEMLSRMGGDAVGMSTVPELVRALECGMRVVGISLISNMAAGIEQGKLSHKDVTEMGNRARHDFESLMLTLLVNMK
jgi:purine-nucleoside phosphorylase